MKWPVGVAIFFAACAPAYASFAPSAPSTLSPASAFDCVNAKVNALGYVIQDANREAGLVRGKTAAPSAVRLNGEMVFNEITVSITKDSVGHTTLNISAHNQKHAAEIVQACGGTRQG